MCGDYFVTFADKLYVLIKLIGIYMMGYNKHATNIVQTDDFTFRKCFYLRLV